MINFIIQILLENTNDYLIQPAITEQKHERKLLALMVQDEQGNGPERDSPSCPVD